jgi:hypothetical protein
MEAPKRVQEPGYGYTGCMCLCRCIETELPEARVQLNACDPQTSRCLGLVSTRLAHDAINRLALEQIQIGRRHRCLCDGHSTFADCLIPTIDRHRISIAIASPTKRETLVAAERVHAEHGLASDVAGPHRLRCQLPSRFRHEGDRLIRMFRRPGSCGCSAAAVDRSERQHQTTA